MPGASPDIPSAGSGKLVTAAGWQLPRISPAAAATGNADLHRPLIPRPLLQNIPCRFKPTIKELLTTMTGSRRKLRCRGTARFRRTFPRRSMISSSIAVISSCDSASPPSSAGPGIGACAGARRTGADSSAGGQARALIRRPGGVVVPCRRPCASRSPAWRGPRPETSSALLESSPSSELLAADAAAAAAAAAAASGSGGGGRGPGGAATLGGVARAAEVTRSAAPARSTGPLDSESAT